MQNIARIPDTASYEGYISLASDDNSNTALKLLSIFDYITYEVAGGEEPEIFIRLNDPNKVQSIVLGNTVYSNNYVTKAKQQHDIHIRQICIIFGQNLNLSLMRVIIRFFQDWQQFRSQFQSIWRLALSTRMRERIS